MNAFEQLFSSASSIILIVLLFGGSIFIHELGHFLAAKKRGLQIDRFSIGFGPKLFGWKRDGVEYRISLLPLGGYVALPQLADMKGIEGDSSLPREHLPPISYSSKVIVSVMGAVFNILFAFAIGVVIWLVGYPSTNIDNSRSIGFLQQTIELEDGSSITSPAVQGGLQLGDEVVRIDGIEVENWNHLRQLLVSGTGVDPENRRYTKLDILRDGQAMGLTIYPEISGDTGMRHLGIGPAHPVIIDSLFEDTNAPAALVGLQRLDTLLSIDGVKLHSPSQLRAYLSKKPGQSVSLEIARGKERFKEQLKVAIVEVTKDGDELATIGIRSFYREADDVHLTPFEQISQHVSMTVRTLYTLLHPDSDISIKHMSGPPGIARILYVTSQIDLRIALWFTVLINVNLAIFNLLPIPVLDGGHILFATIAKLRNRPLAPNFIASVQGTFMLLLFGLMIYVSGHDIARWVGDSKAESNMPEYIEPVFKAEETEAPEE